MKKTVIAFALMTIGFSAFSSETQGGFTDPSATPRELRSANHTGGFSNPNAQITPVSEISNLKDDQYIVLQGKITQQIGHELYLFKDSTGEVEVEIDNDVWRGQTITPSDEVKLFAEIDRDWRKIEVEVKRLEKVN